MVLAAHGKIVPLPQIKRRLRIPRAKGIDAWKLLKCAASYGLPGEGVAGSPGALRRLALPAILHWRKNHFVVLVRWKASGAAEIIDPASGRLTVGVRKFSLEFSGTALRFGQVAKARHRGTEKNKLPLILADDR